jgi:NADH dehydrogenase
MAQSIVILGGGFAGVAVARGLEKMLKLGEATVTLISRENFSLFTPMLPEVSSGGLEARHIVTPVRAELRRTTFVLGDVTNINLESRQIDIVHPISEKQSIYRFDQLVLALGSVTTTFNVPGVAEYSLPMKTLEDAEILRNRVIAALELAAVAANPDERRGLLSFVVVGGGFTGVETAGELVDFFRSINRFYPTIPQREILITLVEGGKSLLPDLSAKMGAYSQKNLSKRGVNVILGDQVAAIDAQGLSLKSGRRIDSSTVIWSAGMRPSPIVEALPVAQTKHGAIVTAEDMSVIGHTGVWALGDSASIPTGESGKTYPPTAQHALREGPVIAKNIVATLRGQATKPFKYDSMGMMASLGARRGVALLPGDIVVTGFLAWMIWRTYYLSRLPGLDRKVRVAFDWFIGLLFSRDIAELRVFTQHTRERAVSDAGMSTKTKLPVVEPTQSSAP